MNGDKMRKPKSNTNPTMKDKNSRRDFLCAPGGQPIQVGLRSIVCRETFILEQTDIARKLGISNNAFRRIAEAAGLKFELINSKRHYKWDEVVEAIQRGKHG
jgi:hypothetical protein